MKLEDILNDLVYGELSTHGIAFNGVIESKDKPRVIAQINNVLTDLYTRFPLLTKEVVVIQNPGITEYHLNSKYAVSNKAVTDVPKYILDTVTDPFTNDILRIENVFDEVGDSLLLNSEDACKVALTPAQDILEIPNPIDTNSLFIIYRARHPKVELNTIDLELPEQLRTALLAGVASRIYSGGTTPEHLNISNNLYQKYELLCSQIEMFGMVNKHETTLNKKPYLGGWI